MGVGRPTVQEKKKQIPRTIKFDTETQACEYLNLLRANQRNTFSFISSTSARDENQRYSNAWSWSYL